jgi:hypothetical protein
MTWDVEVGRAGRYEAVVYYTCPAGATGARIQLSLGDARVASVLREVHDPPLIGKQDDRTPRTAESYVKDFAPISLGSFHLDRTRAPLTLSALEIPGPQVADVRCVALRYIAS